MPLTLSQKPALIICGIRTSPVPNTIAFGGVPTGIMNAQLAAIVAGSSSSGGGTPSAGASAARIGSIVATCAVFDVSSDMNTISATTVNTTSRTGQPEK